MRSIEAKKWLSIDKDFTAKKEKPLKTAGFCSQGLKFVIVTRMQFAVEFCCHPRGHGVRRFQQIDQEEI